MTQETDRDRALAIQRRGHHNRLTAVIAQFKAIGDDPKVGAYATALDALAAVEAAMANAGQPPR